MDETPPCSTSGPHVQQRILADIYGPVASIELGNDGRPCLKIVREAQDDLLERHLPFLQRAREASERLLSGTLVDEHGKPVCDLENPDQRAAFAKILEAGNPKNVPPLVVVPSVTVTP